MPTAAPPRRTVPVVLLLLVGGATLLRFAAIEARSLWFDEAYSLEMARRPLVDLVTTVARQDVHPPFYYVVLSAWSGIFGEAEIALRSLSAVIGAATVAGAWWLGERVGGRAAAVIAALITAVGPLPILASQEARMYPLLGLLAVGSWAALVAALDGRRGGWPAYALVTTLCLYTHYYAAFVLASQMLYVVLTVPRARWRSWLLSQAAVAALFLPWLRVLLGTLLSGKAWPFYRPPLGVATATDVLGLFGFGGHVLGFAGYHEAATAPAAIQMVVLTPFAILIWLGVRAALRAGPAGRLLLAFVVPVPLVFLFSAWKNILYPRYLSFLFVGYAVVAALGVLRVAHGLPQALRRRAVAALSAAVVAINGAVLMTIQRNPAYHSYDWRGTAAALTAGAGPSDLIVAFPGQVRMPLTYYFKGTQRIEEMTPREYLDVTGGAVRDDPAQVARNREILTGYAAAHPAMWIVATRPLPPAALARLQRLLVGIYDYRGEASFKGIVVFHLARHPGTAPP
jgi:4-amino-4-deoxy-L-arabinose transferase-like glycosyltransferase